ncbi:Peptidyl-tRNA hydrolase ICT1, mitochondrial [Nymphon striatum]|nr:Peptidyl-tRNA hydrolase ICT1, mitochondrial [Nymphon striatum]
MARLGTSLFKWRLASSFILKTQPAFGFKSEHSLEKLYPNSSMNFADSSKFQKFNASDDKFTGFVPVDSLKVTHLKSSGPGGQNVNKVNTKVEIRFHLMSAEWIPMKLRELIAEKCKNTITKNGEIFIRSDKTRSQLMNMADCMDKLRTFVRQVEGSVPKPEILSEEMRTIAQAKAKRSAAERIIQKRNRSFTKMQRQS